VSDGIIVRDGAQTRHRHEEEVGAGESAEYGAIVQQTYCASGAEVKEKTGTNYMQFEAAASRLNPRAALFPTPIREPLAAAERARLSHEYSALRQFCGPSQSSNEHAHRSFAQRHKSSEGRFLSGK
jgi:hypothetical protein